MVDADYQLEINLLNFTNPTGRVSTGECCEPMAMNPNTGLCIPEDTCDVRITIRIQNFDRDTRIGAPTNYVLGTFDNVNSIVFPSCGMITSGDDVALNPLTFTFPTSDFTITVSLMH